jgi:N-acetylglutamate synthase
VPLVDDDWVGRRVVVRSVRPDGKFSDVLGVLQACSATTLAVRRRDGSTAVLDRAAVRIVKPVPPAPTPRLRTTPEEVETAAAASWPAPEQQRLGGWTLRAAGGFSRRANSVLPVGDPGVALDAALKSVEQFYAARSLPPLVQVVVGSRLDDDLAAAGWVAHRTPLVHVQVASLAMLVDRLGPPTDATADPVVIDDHLVAGWAELYCGGAVDESARAVLQAPYGDVALAHVDRASAPVAVGRGALTGPWLAIAALHVQTNHRRQGLGRAVVAALTRWGWSRGARWALLQVDDGNTAAQALYDGLGFTTHHRVHWRGPGMERPSLRS